MIIGIAGQLANGKDVVADYLAKVLNSRGGNWKRIGFAHNVKKIFMEAFGVDLEFIEEWKRKTDVPPGFIKNIRQSLQFIGDGFRTIKPTVWTDLIFKSKEDIIISDVRYMNEINGIRERNGVVILLYRPGYLNNDPNLSEAQIKPLIEHCNNNLEEGKLDGESVDFFIKNDGNLEDLYDKIDKLIIPYLVQHECFKD